MTSAIILGSCVMSLIFIALINYNTRLTQPKPRQHPLDDIENEQDKALWSDAYVLSNEQECHIAKHRADDESRVILPTGIKIIEWASGATSYIPEYMPRIGSRRFAIITPTGEFPMIKTRASWARELVSA